VELIADVLSALAITASAGHPDHRLLPFPTTRERRRREEADSTKPKPVHRPPWQRLGVGFGGERMIEGIRLSGATY